MKPLGVGLLIRPPLFFMSLIGQTFSRLTVIEDTGKRKNRAIIWKAECSCGVTIEVITASLKNGNTKSCGCLQKEKAAITGAINLRGANYKHGKWGTREYKNFHFNKYKAEKLLRTPSWVNLDKIREIYEMTPKGWDVDHILPLQGKLICGLHVAENLQSLPHEVHKHKLNSFTPYSVTKDGQVTYYA